jgi:hypothetical protein
MPSTIDLSPSGRAKCRACGQAISRGELRFGEALPSAYGEGESLFWFHLQCAACARPESLLPVLALSTVAIPERGLLEALAEAGVAEPRLCRILRGERASSGRARCRHCREAIAQGAFRLALQMFEEGRFNPIGTIHATCAIAYLGAEPALERLNLPISELAPEELTQLLGEMRAAREGALESPGLAKTSAPEEEAKPTRQSS